MVVRGHNASRGSSPIYRTVASALRGSRTGTAMFRGSIAGGGGYGPTPVPVYSVPPPEDIDAAPLSTGVTTQTWSGWYQADSLTVFTSAGVQNIRDTATDGRIFLRTQQSARDVEVDFWCTRAVVYLRLDSNGKAYYCDLNTNAGAITIGVATGVTEASGGTLYPRATISTSSIPGYVKDAATDTWTFGVRGHRVYLRWNGNDALGRDGVFGIDPIGRDGFNDPFHLFGVGAVAVRGVSGSPSFGIARLSVDFEQHAMHSPTYVDVRDLGVKASDLTLRASIAAGSNTATLSSANHNIEKGDTVIFEPSEGRGETGVGGHWPSQIYPNAAAIAALVPSIAGHAVGNAEDGTVWCTVNGVAPYAQIAESNTDGNWYFAKITPRPLVAIVTAVNGAEITLDTAAFKDATNIRVFIEALGRPSTAGGFTGTTLVRRFINDKIQYRRGSGTGPPNSDLSAIWPASLRLHWPAGNYASYAGAVVAYRQDGLTITGDGSGLTKFYSPNWCGDHGFDIYLTDTCSMSGMGSRGGYRLSSYGWHLQMRTFTDAGGPVNPDVISFVGTYPTFRAVQSEHVTYDDLAVTDSWQGVAFSGSGLSSGTRLSSAWTEKSRRYQTWHMSISDSDFCTMQIDSMDSVGRIDGFEMVKSANCEIVVAESRNAVGSLNSALLCTVRVDDGVLEDGAIDGTFAESSTQSQFLSVFDHFGTNNCDDNDIQLNIRILEATRNVNGISAGHDFTGTQLHDSRIEHVQASRYGIDSDDSAGENEWLVDNVEFVGCKARLRLGSISNSSGPALERESDVTVTDCNFDSETVI